MIELLGLFLKDNWKPLAVVAGVAVIVGGIYLKGRSDEAASKEQAAKTAVTQQLQQRNSTDEKVERMSPAQLCGTLNGMWSDNRCQ